MAEANGGQSELRAADAARLRELLNEHPDAVATVTDPAGQLIWGTRAGSEHLFGRHPIEYVGRDIWQYIHPRDILRVTSGMHQAARGNTAKFSYRARTADNRWQWMTEVAWSTTLNTGEPAIVHVAVPTSGPPSGDG